MLWWEQAGLSRDIVTGIHVHSTKTARMAVHDMPDKKKLRRSIFFPLKQTAPYVQTCMASVYGQGPVHTDLRQNTSVERECRTGRHVYEASIQIFKLTLLEKGMFGFNSF